MMENLLKLLIYKIETIDGSCGSSKGIEKALKHQYFK